MLATEGFVQEDAATVFSKTMLSAARRSRFGVVGRGYPASPMCE